MTRLEQQIKQLQKEMAKMLSQPSYNSVEFDKKMEKCRSLQKLNEIVDEEEQESF